MFCDTVVVFDHLRRVIKVISHFRKQSDNPSKHEIEVEYLRAKSEISRVVDLLGSDDTPLPVQSPITTLDDEVVSNVGRKGYEGFVHTLKEHIIAGDIIQAVPSQRISKKTSLHPFNAYRRLRSTNPSPYMFYVDLVDFQVFNFCMLFLFVLIFIYLQISWLAHHLKCWSKYRITLYILIRLQVLENEVLLQKKMRFWLKIS